MVPASKNTDFLIKEVARGFVCGEYFYMRGKVKLFLPSITKNPIETDYRLAIWNLL